MYTFKAMVTLRNHRSLMAAAWIHGGLLYWLIFEVFAWDHHWRPQTNLTTRRPWVRLAGCPPGAAGRG